MEKKLKALFDLQKFEENRNLQQVIDSVHAKYAVRELSLDDMEFVAAAGIPELQNKQKNGEK
jgi:hypothetical protein